MKIEYMRNMQFGYMRLEQSDPLTKTEEAMLAHNAIEGLLPVCWQKENDRYFLRYDITGKQALDSVLEQTMAEENLVRRLLIGIYVTIRELEKYLLPQEGLFLSPETIFFDPKTETMHFCFFTEVTDSLQVQLIKLMEYILAKTDHKNVIAVQLVYGAYEVVQKDSFCIEDLHIYLKESNRDVESEVLIEEDSVLPVARCGQVSDNEEERTAIWKRGAEWLRNATDRMREVISCSKRRKKEMSVIYEKARVSQEGETTVLGNMSNRTEGILQYEGTRELPDLRIDKNPFLIGSAIDCDGVIQHPNISRRHAKITIRDGVYFIEDLNSTNGTKVNGGLLNYKTKVSVRKGTGIHFANEPYRFM